MHQSGSAQIRSRERVPRPESASVQDNAIHRSVRSLHTSPRLVFAGAHSALRGRDFPLHQHPTWELVYYRRGRIRAPIGAESYDASPGTLLATPPRTEHAEIALTAYENYFVGVDAPPTAPWPRVAFDDSERSLGRVISAIVREHAAPTIDQGMVDLLVAELDLLLRRAALATAPGHAERLVTHAERLLEERYAQRVRISDVAREVGASESALRAHFVAQRDVTPMEYLQSVRLRHALAHLRHSTMTLDAVAELAGYHSASHLSRHVKRMTGARPGELRRSALLDGSERDSAMTKPRDDRDEPVLPQRSEDETDVGWGDDVEDDDERLRRDVPPHHIDTDNR